jgi:TnpA family transposase
MITGLLRHASEMQVDRNYVDTHGQSEIGFAFCSLLGFQLLPRLKNLHAQKLYRPETGHPDAYPNLQPVLTRPIRWELIRQHYDEMVKFATALRLGTAETEEILRRFTRNGVQHPTYGLSLVFARIDTMCQITRDTRYNSASPVAKGYEARHGGKTCPLPRAQKLAS